MPARESARPLTSLLTQAVSELAYLLQTEIRLARAEVSEKVAAAANGGVMLGVAVVLLLPALFVLMLDIARWIEIAGLPDHWALLIVGGVAALIGIGLALAGARRFKASALMPQRTMEQVRADFTIAKEHVP
jgi:uncharacterized membrane protein YqjE